MLSDSLFSDVSWLFFVIWSIVVGIFSVAAFSHDLIPSKALTDSKPRGGRKTLGE
jgi:hypothetical protein